MRRQTKILAVAVAVAMLPMGIRAGIQKETKLESPSDYDGKTYAMDGYLKIPADDYGEFRLVRSNSDEFILDLTAEQRQFARDCQNEPIKIEGVYHDGGYIVPDKFCHWYLDDTAWKMVCECNKYRVAHNLQPLQPSRGLLRTAFQHTWNMRHRYGFRHGGTSGWSGENIAMGQPNVESVTQDWYQSAGHRANMLNGNYRYIGVGYYNGMWAQQFR